MIEVSPDGDDAARIGVAGDTFNTAVYIKRLAPEIDVDYITRLGDDPFSDRIAAAVAAEEIGTDGIETEPGGTPGLYAITTRDDGERSFTYWRSEAAARRLFQREGGCDFSVLAPYDMVYLSGISLAILPENVRADLLAFLSDRHIPFAFDSNYRPKLWESVSAARDCMTAYFDKAALVLPSIDDEMALHAEAADAVLARFKALGTKGAVKRGAEGPVSLGEAVSQRYKPAPRVVDTTAAGDSFNGGYLAATLQGRPQEAALMTAHTCAANVVQHRGAILPRSHTFGEP